eukprot:1515845-Rhodomonas_salina.1
MTGNPFHLEVAIWMSEQHIAMELPGGMLPATSRTVDPAGAGRACSINSRKMKTRFRRENARFVSP